MTMYTCPCCGSSFNGKKCRSCLYETFDEEISHRLHVHKGEPLVIREPSRRPIPRKDPFGCERKTRKSRVRIPKWLIWILAFTLAEPLLGAMVSLMEPVIDNVSLREPAIPEPDASVPEDAAQVLSQEGLTVYLGTSEDGQTYPVFLENLTDQDVYLASQSITADGFLTEQSFLWCEAPAGTLRQGQLYLDQEDLDWAIAGTPGHIQADLVIYDADSYEDILRWQFSIDTGEEAQPVVPEGDVLVENQQLGITLLGYQPDSYSADIFSEGVLRFYLENHGETPLSIYSEGALLNGEEADIGFWCHLPGNTRTVTRVFLFSAEEHIQSLDQLESLELHLRADCGEAGLLDLGWIPLNLS